MSQMSELPSLAAEKGSPDARWLVSLILLVWACVYLPELGARELQGNEARRILPARTMLATGKWLVPELAGRPYFKKPPLINWMIAASLRITGRDDEWTCRLPTTLCVLAYALMLVAVPCRWMDVHSRALAALVFLTSLGIMIQGRSTEIDPVLACISGMAIWWWISHYPDARRPYRLWLPSGVFLGIGLLLKGPLILLFFYAAVIAVLLIHGDIRALFKPAHLGSVLLMLAMFAFWAAPALSIGSTQAVQETWSGELTNKIHKPWDPLSWIRLFLGSGMNFMPWLLVVPSAFRRQRRDSGAGRGLAGLWIAAGICFAALSLMPGARPRYTIPLLAVTCIPLGHYLGQCGFDRGSGAEGLLSRGARILGVTFMLGAGAQLGLFLWTRHRGIAPSTTPQIGTVVLASAATLALVLSRRRLMELSRHPWGHPIGAVLLLACAGLQVNTFVTPAMSLADYKRPVGRKLGQYLDPGQTLHLYIDDRDQYKPFLYYLPYSLAYLGPGQDLDPHMQYLFAVDGLYTQTARRLVQRGLQIQTLCRLEYKHDDYFLGKVMPIARREAATAWTP